MKRLLAIALAFGMVMINLPLAVLAQSGSGEARAKIAVWDFTLEGMQKGDGRAVTNRLRSELVGSGKFQIMSRDQIKTLLGEQALGQTLVDAKEAIKAGKLKGVKYVVTGTIVSVRGAFQITAEMIDGESAEIIQSITPPTYRGPFLDFLDNEIPRLAAQLAGETPPPVASKPPPRAERRPQPEPPPQEAPADGGMSGVGVAGVISLVAAGVFQIIAMASASTAGDDADAATTDAEYQTALDDRDSAESLQGVAAVFGILGVILLIVDASVDNSTADGGYGPGAAPVGFNMDVQPNSLMAGYALRW